MLIRRLQPHIAFRTLTLRGYFFCAADNLNSKGLHLKLSSLLASYRDVTTNCSKHALVA